MRFATHSAKHFKNILIKENFMKKILMAAVAAMTMTFAGGNIVTEQEVQVEPALTGLYVGGGYTYIDAELASGGTTVKESENAGTVLAGYNFNEYVALEGRYTFSTDINYAGLNTQVDGDVWGIYVKPQYPVSNDFKVYALLGYGDVIDLDDGDGFQYGVGAAYSATKNVEVFVDWVRAYDDKIELTSTQNADFTVDLFTFGVNYKF